MQILFVDESDTPPPLGKQETMPYFVLGGIVVPEDMWAKLAADLKRLKEHFNIDDEIKWRCFAPPREGQKTHSYQQEQYLDLPKPY